MNKISVLLTAITIQATLVQSAMASTLDVCKYDGNRYAYCQMKDGKPSVIIASINKANLVTQHSKEMSASGTASTQTRMSSLARAEGSVDMDALESKLVKSRQAIEHRMIFFAEEAKIPEMVQNGERRHFPRFLAKMRYNFFAINLAKQEYLNGLNELNSARTKNGLKAYPADMPQPNKEVRWAYEYWQSIKDEMNTKWGPGEIDKLADEYLKTVIQERALASK